MLRTRSWSGRIFSAFFPGPLCIQDKSWKANRFIPNNISQSMPYCFKHLSMGPSASQAYLLFLNSFLQVITPSVIMCTIVHIMIRWIGNVLQVKYNYWHFQTCWVQLYTPRSMLIGRDLWRSQFELSLRRNYLMLKFCIVTCSYNLQALLHLYCTNRNVYVAMEIVSKSRK